jgi:hypothetical protein
MARIRTVKPELFRHEDLFEAEKETELPLRLAFIGLFTCCDREGRFEWRPRQLKLDVMPYDEIDFSRVLDALATRGFVFQYTVQGKGYGCIPSFSRHQVVNNREKASVIPSADQVEAQHAEDPMNTNNLTNTSRVNDASPTRNDLYQGEGEREREGEGNKQLQQQAKVFESEPLQEFTSPEELTERWQPEQTTIQRILMLNIPEEFIRDCIPEFVGFWLTANKKPFGGNYETSFFKSTQRAWVQHQNIKNQRGNGNGSSQQFNSGPDQREALESTDWLKDFGKNPFSDSADAGGRETGELVDYSDNPDFSEVAGTIPLSGRN